MKLLRRIVEIDEELCDGCGQCVPTCAEGAIEVIGGKARLAAERYCDGLGACLGDCPRGALRIVERLADDFDETALEEHLTHREKSREQKDTPFAGGCPSARIQTFLPDIQDGKKSDRKAQGLPGSRLNQWPVQINLVPPTAPFLKGADLLVVADCVPIAYPAIHEDFLPGKVIMIGCPKFDDVGAYVEKFADIFRTAGIKSVTALVMEVPCCSGLPGILKKAMTSAGEKIPLKEVIISTRGDILEEGFFSESTGLGENPARVEPNPEKRPSRSS